MGDRQPAAGTCAPFGRTPDGREARVWTIGAEGGLVARVSDLGACLASLLVPHDGTYLDVVLGYDDAAGYATDDAHLGAVIGRVANRIGGARLELGGRVVRLAANEGANSNHSGPDLWRRRLWRLVSAGPASVTLELDSPDGDQGFPGAVRARVTYEVTRGALRISYDARADATTAINLTNHSYFNLNGQGSGSALGHRVQVLADRYTEVDGGNVPTGRLLDVAGTPLDLREPRRLGEASALFGREHGGFDHNYETRGFRPAEGRVGEPRRRERVGRREWPAHGRLHRPARPAALHGQLPRRGARKGRRGLPAARRRVLRDAVLPRRPQPPRVRPGRLRAATPLRLHDRVPLRRRVGEGPPRAAGRPAHARRTRGPHPAPTHESGPPPKGDGPLISSASVAARVPACRRGRRVLLAPGGTPACAGVRYISELPPKISETDLLR
ncbi:MAG: aldose epimerase family protein [Olsenella sp.]|jgi:aldose 1-epimerase